MLFNSCTAQLNFCSDQHKQDLTEKKLLLVNYTAGLISKEEWQTCTRIIDADATTLSNISKDPASNSESDSDNDSASDDHDEYLNMCTLVTVTLNCK